MVVHVSRRSLELTSVSARRDSEASTAKVSSWQQTCWFGRGSLLTAYKYPPIDFFFFFFGFFLSLKSDVTYGVYSFMAEPSFIILAGQFISKHKINLSLSRRMMTEKSNYLFKARVGPTICLPINIMFKKPIHWIDMADFILDDCDFCSLF